MDLNQHHILRYVGAALEVTIPDEIEQIDESCFEDCKSIRSVQFGVASRLSSIQSSAFSSCSLHKITIPSAVKSLGARCFQYCWMLEMVSFCPGSQIVRIETNAFSNCSSLQSMLIPSSVEFIAEYCFEMCRALSRLTFDSPSHLRELLDRPEMLSDFFPIPDSVEILSVPIIWGSSHFQTLTFGPDSRLGEIRRVRGINFHGARCRSFLRLSAGNLKRFRISLEFQSTGKQKVESGTTAGAASRGDD
jgi:hypothetical protein